MWVEATIQRIGGSTFARLPPKAVKALGLTPGDAVELDIVKRGKTLREILAAAAKMPRWKGPALAKSDVDFEGDRWERLEKHGHRNRR